MAFRKKEECKKPPAWLTSFSDLMSLLLTFFILIYAMSSLDIAQLEKFISYFQPERKFYIKKTSIIPPINPPPKDVALKIKRQIFFEEGSYRLTPKAKKALEEVAQVLTKLPERSFIRVEGHVSEVVEIKDPLIRDKWELSVRRATEVVRFLQAQGVAPEKLSAAGFGDTRPLYTWRQPILMDRNNRVEIYINLVKRKE